MSMLLSSSSELGSDKCCKCTRGILPPPPPPHLLLEIVIACKFGGNGLCKISKDFPTPWHSPHMETESGCCKRFDSARNRGAVSLMAASKVDPAARTTGVPINMPKNRTSELSATLKCGPRPRPSSDVTLRWIVTSAAPPTGATPPLDAGSNATPPRGSQAKPRSGCVLDGTPKDIDMARLRITSRPVSKIISRSDSAPLTRITRARLGSTVASTSNRIVASEPTLSEGAMRKTMPEASFASQRAPAPSPAQRTEASAYGGICRA